jgi:hypothetical protein
VKKRNLFLIKAMDNDGALNDNFSKRIGFNIMLNTAKGFIKPDDK